MFKSIAGIILGIGVIILGLVLIAVPTTGWNGEAISSGFQALQNMNVVSIFSQPEVGLTAKIGVGLAVYAGPIITVLGIIAFLVKMFSNKK